MLLSTVREVATGHRRVQGAGGDGQAAGVGHGRRVRSGFAQRLGPGHGLEAGDTEDVRPGDDVC